MDNMETNGPDFGAAERLHQDTLALLDGEASEATHHATQLADSHPSVAQASQHYADIHAYAAQCVREVAALRADLAALREALQGGVQQLRVSAMMNDWGTFDQVCRELRQAARASQQEGQNDEQ